MTAAFWTTIAQVSATFAGFVFVGFSIYLGSIREATAAVKRSLPEAKEVLGGLIYIIIYSNLLFYWLPLLLSLTSLGKQVYPVQAPAVKVMFVGSLLLFLLLYRGLRGSRNIREQWWNIRNAERFPHPPKAALHDKGREQAERLLQAIRLRKWIWWRMQVGEWLTYSNFLVILGLYIYSLLQSGEQWLQIWAIVNLGLGVTFSLIDLALFRPDNVFFSNVDRLVAQMESQAREICDLMKTLSEQFPKIRPSLSKEARDDLERRYETLRGHIPESEDSLPLVEEFKELGSIVSLGEMRGYSEGLSLLQEGVKDLIERIKAYGEDQAG